MEVKLTNSDALIIVDVQNDFLPGGRLAIPGSDQIVPVLNQYIAFFSSYHLPIFASRDWHPVNHCSFQPQGGLWPVHCVAGSHGAAFPSNLSIPTGTHIISKATSQNTEAYSAFSGTQLYTLLQTLHIKRIFLSGLATEYCVFNTVKDALRYRFKTIVLEDAICAVDRQPDDGQQAIAEMKQNDVLFIHYKDLAI